MMRLVVHQWRYDMRALWRNPQSRFFTVALPIIFLVIFVSVFGDKTLEDGVKASTYYVPGIAALGVIAASFLNVVIAITAQREAGVLKRRRATPLPALALIAGRTLTAVIVSCGLVAVLLVIGRFAFGVKLATHTLPGVAITTSIGSVAFCSLGYALSTAISSEDAAQPVVQAITLPLYFISGVFVPRPDLPTWLRDLAKLFPVEHLAAGLHHAFDPTTTGSGVPWSDIGILAVWGTAGFAVALVRFSWTPTADREPQRRPTMATTTETRTGMCSTHGTVQAERRLPKLTFPFVVTLPLRYVAKLRPFRCPECGAAVSA